MWIANVKIRNVKIGDNQYKTFHPGEELPEDYNPPIDYAINKIVVKKTKKTKKNGGIE